MANGMPNRSPFRVEGPALQGFRPLAAEGSAITPLIVPRAIQGPIPGQVPFEFAGPAPGMVGVSQVGVRIPAEVPQGPAVEVPRTKSEAISQSRRTRAEIGVQPSGVQWALPTFAQLAPMELPTVLAPGFAGQVFSVPQFAPIGPPNGAQLARQQFELPSTGGDVRDTKVHVGGGYVFIAEQAGCTDLVWIQFVYEEYTFLNEAERPDRMAWISESRDPWSRTRPLPADDLRAANARSVRRTSHDRCSRREQPCCPGERESWGSRRATR